MELDKETKTGEEDKPEHVDFLIFLVMIHIDLHFFYIFTKN